MPIYSYERPTKPLRPQRNTKTQKTKMFNFGIAYQCYGTVSVEVPSDFTYEQAKQYVLDNWANIHLPSQADYVQDSDEPDFDSWDFEDIEEKS